MTALEKACRTPGSNPDRDSKKDAYYTSPQLVKMVQEFFKDFLFAQGVKYTIVCPTAGDGRLTLENEFLPEAHLSDLDPKHPSIKQQDFNSLDVNALGHNIIVFENPPFSQHYAVKFFNAMAHYSNVKYIAIIFPDRFRGDQTSSDGKSILDRHFHLVDHMPIKEGLFEEAGGRGVQIPASFQIWKRRETPRKDLNVGVTSMTVTKKNASKLSGGLIIRTSMNMNQTRSTVTQNRSHVIYSDPIKNKSAHLYIHFKDQSISDPEQFAMQVTRKCYDNHPELGSFGFTAGIFMIAACEVLNQQHLVDPSSPPPLEQP